MNNVNNLSGTVILWYNEHSSLHIFKWYLTNSYDNDVFSNIRNNFQKLEIRMLWTLVLFCEVNCPFFTRILPISLRVKLSLNISDFQIRMCLYRFRQIIKMEFFFFREYVDLINNSLPDLKERKNVNQRQAFNFQWKISYGHLEYFFYPIKIWCCFGKGALPGINLCK